LEKELKNQIEYLNLKDRIHIVPEVDEETLHSFYEACDIFVLPSIEKSETYGIVQIEAMACGKPVICTELNTGTSFINQHEKTGIVVPPKNTEVLYDAIMKLLKNTEYRQELGYNAKQRALNNFTSDIMVGKTYEMYKDLF
jgi:glycosyltransferase involved in cell wall biosynthesis